jgi:site-specific DNA-adenine methylase
MKIKLSAQKKIEYDKLCNDISELSQEIDRLIKENKDTSEMYEQLEATLNKCVTFITKEFYNRGS